ncbi:MAG: LAGLIDADG family homing endonuclease [Patescibacteria group bacterium]
MPRKWTKEEEDCQHHLLKELYIDKNLTIFQIAEKLGIAYQTVYNRLNRLGIKTVPYLKPNYTNKRTLKNIRYSKELAEFIGIMCGDGHISKTQVIVNLGSKELDYTKYIKSLFKKLFGEELKSYNTKEGYLILYIGYVELIGFLKKMGLVNNKVKDQVGIPKWIFYDMDYMRGFIKGFFDTDGSVYKLRWGNQISFCNHSLKLLKDTRRALKQLGFSPSRISLYNMYLTRKMELIKFYREIGSNNPRKSNRFKEFISN